MAEIAKNERSLAEIAAGAVELARRAGAAEAAAQAVRSRSVQVVWRDGKIETLTEATERKLDIDLYVEGRYASVNTSDLRPDAIASFVNESIALTRKLELDKDRRLPDPELYQGRSTADLQLDDRTQAEVTPDDRKRYAAAAEEAARAVASKGGAGEILSVSSGSNDGWQESAMATSNGFQGSRRSSSFVGSTSVSVKDKDGSRPEDGAFAFTIWRKELPAAETIGRMAAERAFGRLGSVKGKSEVLPAVIENRAARRMSGLLLGPLFGEALQQKRSFLEGKKGQAIGSKLLDLTDDPLLPRAFASRHYDGEGIATRRRPIFEGGVLRDYYLDTYYARKLGVAPTSGTMTNLRWKLGDKGLDALVAQTGEAILITSFLGGNANGATGDFSLGVRGVRIRKGKPAEVIGEMNVSGNQLELWKHLVAVGNDPYTLDSGYTPTLVFERMQFAGV